MREKLRALAEGGEGRPPEPLKGGLVNALLSILVVSTSEEYPVKAHLGEETSVGVRVAERVDVPADSGLHAYLLQQVLMPDDHVVELVFVVSAGLIVHAPACVHKLKAAFFGEGPHVGLGLLGLVLPPHGEELHLDLRVLATRVL